MLSSPAARRPSPEYALFSGESGGGSSGNPSGNPSGEPSGGPPGGLLGCPPGLGYPPLYALSWRLFVVSMILLLPDLVLFRGALHNPTKKCS
jgi:hypothetical protein